MILDFTTNNSLKQYTAILQRHLDSYGNSVCEEIKNELKQVIDREVLLEQVPHPYLGIEVIYPKKNLIDGTVENIVLKEIDPKDSIKEGNEIKIDYNTGKIIVHYELEGKYLNINYWGRGYYLIHSSRVYTKLDEYGDICQTLEELLDMLYKLGNTDYIVNILQDIENAKTSIVNGVSYSEINERLNSIEQNMKDFLTDVLNLGSQVEEVELEMENVKNIVDDVNYRMEVLENNYLNPKFVTNAEIDEIIGRLI